MAGALQVKLKGSEKLLVAPSLLSADILNLENSIAKLDGAYDWLHLDVMDGHFVPNLSYGPSLLKALRRKYPDAFIDVHIMVEPAESFVPMFLAGRPSLLTVHAEATPHLHRVLQSIKAEGVLAGIAINPATPAESILPVLNLADVVLVMSVNPGFGGQKFIPEVLEKVCRLAELRKERNYDYLIEMDGGLGPENAALAAAHGCDIAVAGNAVFGSPNPAETVRKMKVAGGENNG